VGIDSSMPTLMKRILVLMGLAFLIGLYPVRCLVAIDEAGQIVFWARVDTNEQIIVKYVHSVEKTPWHHYYRVGADKRLYLTHMRFKSFGAGVPHYAPVVRHVDGWIEYAGFGESFASITWNVRDDLHHYLVWRGHDIRLGTRVVSGMNIRLEVTDLPIVTFLRLPRGGLK